MDDFAVFLLFFRKVFVFIFGQQVGQDEDAVQRRPQLVRHVGQEFRLIAAALLECRRLLGKHFLGRFQLLFLLADLSDQRFEVFAGNHPLQCAGQVVLQQLQQLELERVKFLDTDQFQ